MRGMWMPASTGLAGLAWMFFAVQSVAAQVAPDTTIHLAPEVWLAIAGGLVTVGISIDQLRRTRRDVGSLSKQVKQNREELEDKIEGAKSAIDTKLARLPDEYVRRDYWKDAVDAIVRTGNDTNARIATIERALIGGRRES
jgi:hypothetical protein